MPPFAETAAAAASPDAKLFDEPLVDRNKFGAISNFLYVLAGVALFTTGTAPVITPETDFLNDPFAMAWAGWKFTGCLFFAMVNWGVSLPTSNAIAMTIYVLFDIFAVMDTEHWTSAAYGFILIDGLIGILSLRGHFKFGAISNFLYVLAGVALFTTGAAPVITPDTDFLNDPFAMAWAGWKFTGCLFFAMVNWGVSLPTSNAIAMTIYVAFDIFAVMDTEHWTSAAYGFILIDGLIGILSVRQIVQRRLHCGRSGATGQPSSLLPDGTPKSDEMLDAAANAA